MTKTSIISVFFNYKILKSDVSGSEKAGRAIYGFLKKLALFEISNLFP